MKKYLPLLGIILLSSMACSSDGAVSTENTFSIIGSDGSATEPALSKGSSVIKALGSPTQLNAKVYAAWLSPNEDCSDPILIEDNGATPVEYDLTDHPTLLGSSPTPGSYPCIILKISDQITFTADAAAVADNPICVDTTTLHTIDVYRVQDGEPLNLDIDGNEIPVHGTRIAPVDDTIFLFATTNPDAYMAATGSGGNEVATIDSNITVPGNITVTFDFTDHITTSSDDDHVTDFCWAEGPGVSFESE